MAKKFIKKKVKFQEPKGKSQRSQPKFQKPKKKFQYDSSEPDSDEDDEYNSDFHDEAEFDADMDNISEAEEKEGHDNDTSQIGQETKEEKRSRKERKKFDFEKNARTIFVGNLPAEMDNRKVAQLFKTFGTVESSRIRSIVPDKETLSPKVALISNKIHPKVNSFNAYVVFTDLKSVTKALTMNGKEVDGHRIRVDLASRPRARKETLTSRKKSIFVGNLRFDIRDDELLKYFELRIGPVNYVRIVRDSSTGLGKGFGFVVFKERASVKKALSLNETALRGRPIRVKKVEEEGKGKKKNQ